MLTFPSIVKLTVTGLRISAVDTVAFIDNCADLIPYAGSGRRIRIKDAAGKYLDGVLGARGTGETMGENLIVNNADFSSDEPPGTAWTRAGNWVITGGVAVASVTAGSLLPVGVPITTGALYTVEADLVISAGGIYYRMDATNYKLFTTSGSKKEYRTSVAGLIGFVNADTMTGSVDNASIKQVLTPSTSGLLIRNLAGAQSFQSQESGFTHNAASYAVEVFDMMKVV